jgi:hypothetical protein
VFGWAEFGSYHTLCEHGDKEWDKTHTGMSGPRELTVNLRPAANRQAL